MWTSGKTGPRHPIPSKERRATACVTDCATSPGSAAVVVYAVFVAVDATAVIAVVVGDVHRSLSRSCCWCNY